jgi:uncharacterized membrane protein
MRRPNATRVAVIAWAPAVAAAVAWPLAQQHAVAPLRWMGGALLAFLLPGLALTAALFFGRVLSIVERSVLAPALSLAVLILGGLALNAARIRLTGPAWATMAASVTLVCAAIGYFRWWWATRDRGALPVEASPDDDISRRPAATRRQLVLKLASLVAIVGLLVVASRLALNSAVAQTQAPFTALSIVQADDTNTTDTLRPVDIAVDSHEADTTQYFVQVIGAQTGLINQFTISLVPGQVYKTQLQVPRADKVTVDLYKGSASVVKPYRSVFVSGLQ